MIRATFFPLITFSCILIGMEHSDWRTIKNWQEMNSCQEVIIAYEPRLKLGENLRKVISEKCNYAYVVPHFQLFTELISAPITKLPMQIPINKKPYLMLATLSSVAAPTRLLSDATMQVEPLLMRLATDEELRNILSVMKKSSELTFDFNCHSSDFKDTCCKLKRYCWNDIEILRELNKNIEQANKK
jgi:hypothetical protein